MLELGPTHVWPESRVLVNFILQSNNRNRLVLESEFHFHIMIQDRLLHATSRGPGVFLVSLPSQSAMTIIFKI